MNTESLVALDRILLRSALIVAMISACLTIVIAAPHVWPLSQRCVYMSDARAARWIGDHMRDKFQERFGNFYPGKRFEDLAVKTVARHQAKDKDTGAFIELDVVDAGTGTRLNGFMIYPSCRIEWTDKRFAPSA